MIAPTLTLPRRTGEGFLFLRSHLSSAPLKALLLFVLFVTATARADPTPAQVFVQLKALVGT